MDIQKVKKFIELQERVNREIEKLNLKYMENVDLKNERNNANTLLYADIKLGMNVTDELSRKGRIIASDDIDNIKVSFGNGHAEYYSLREDNPDGVSKLYICV